MNGSDFQKNGVQYGTWWGKRHDVTSYCITRLRTLGNKDVEPSSCP